jgi:photosystem II stability/assembly factor-like uncharacterized protein
MLIRTLFVLSRLVFPALLLILPTLQPAQTDPPTWVRTGGPIGGLGYDIRYNYADHDVWYVTDAWSGFYVSTDRGLTWTPSNHGITARKGIDSIPVFCVTVDPHDPQRLWIGSEGTGGIFLSTDGGQTWAERTQGVDPTLRPLTFRGFTIDPRTSDVVYAMAEIGSPAWTPDHEPRRGLEQDLTQGIVYRTTDGGEHWEPIWRGDNLARYLWVDPRDPDVLYVSTGIFDREAANTDVAAGFAGGVGILKSTDGGQTWRVLDQEQGLLDLYVGSLAMKLDEPDVLLAAAGQNNWSGHEGRATAGVYYTADGGEHWERVLEGELFSVVEYCDFDPETAYAASASAVYRSEDGGRTWQRFSRANDTWGPPGLVAGFPIDMQCDPDDPLRVLVNNYLGGNFVSSDGGQTWALASEGYTGALVHHLAVAPGQPRTVFAGTRSGVYRSDDGGDTWTGLVHPPAGMQAKFNEIRGLAVDPADPEHLITMPADLGALLVSHDGGQSWREGQWLGGLSAIRFAPSDPSHVYATVAPEEYLDPDLAMERSSGCDQPEIGLYVSRDGGETWQQVDSGSVGRGTPISALAIDPEDAEKIYVSIAGTGLLRSTDGGGSWTPIGEGLPSLPVIAMAIDPRQPDTLFAGVAAGMLAPGGGGIYRSTDGGHHWQPSGTGLNPEALVRTIVVDPTDSDTIYAGDHTGGVYISRDGGATWYPLNTGLGNRTINVLALADDGSVLYAGTMGDGVYRLDMEPPAEPEPQPSPSPLAAEPPLGVSQPENAAEPSPGGRCTAALVLPLMLAALASLSHRRS